MAKRLHPLCVRYCLEAECSTEVETGTLTRRLLQFQQLFVPPCCLIDNVTHLNAMCDAVEGEATQLPAPAAPTEEPRSCHFIVINFLCVYL